MSSHVAAVNVNPSPLHDDTPLGAKNVSQVGWQVVPRAKLSVQSPAPPLAGAADASQVFSSHWCPSFSPQFAMQVYPFAQSHDQETPTTLQTPPFDAESHP
jgi:hypothetical protein